jgi:hypothetical protein
MRPASKQMENNNPAQRKQGCHPEGHADILLFTLRNHTFAQKKESLKF